MIMSALEARGPERHERTWRSDGPYWMAAALLGSIPVAIIYSFFVEHYVAGLTAGGVKG